VSILNLVFLFQTEKESYSSKISLTSPNDSISNIQLVSSNCHCYLSSSVSVLSTFKLYHKNSENISWRIKYYSKIYQRDN